jgi:hypothetical protein
MVAWQNNGMTVCAMATEAVDKDDYNLCYACDLSYGHKVGGVVCHADAYCPSVRLQLLETVDLETILGDDRLVPSQVSHLVSRVIHHPPDDVSGPTASHIVDSIDDTLQQLPHAGVVILGDCNALNDKPVCDYPR